MLTQFFICQLAQLWEEESFSWSLLTISLASQSVKITKLDRTERPLELKNQAKCRLCKKNTTKKACMFSVQDSCLWPVHFLRMLKSVVMFEHHWEVAFFKISFKLIWNNFLWQAQTFHDQNILVSWKEEESIGLFVFKRQMLIEMLIFFTMV